MPIRKDDEVQVYSLPSLVLVTLVVWRLATCVETSCVLGPEGVRDPQALKTSKSFN